MKRYKLLTWQGYPNLTIGEVYQEDYKVWGSTTVLKLVVAFPKDWEEVVGEVETDEEIIEQLINNYGYDDINSYKFLESYKYLNANFNLKLNVEDVVNILCVFDNDK